MNCTCPDEDKYIYNLEDCCTCTYCDIDIDNASVPAICKNCKLPKCREL